MSGSKLIKLLNNDPNFFYYNGNNSGGLGNFKQKSLHYGNDRQGDGDSGQPYITTAIPNRHFTSPVDDGFIRGGWYLANKASNEDALRISKFLKDNPKGPLFIQRQIGLQLSNPKLETRQINLTGFGTLGSLISVGFNVFNQLVPGPTRLYNEGKNTLSQLPATAFGTHFERHGLSPIQDDNTKYLAVVYNNNQNNNNRLLALKKKLIKPGITDPRSGNIVIGTINAILGAVNVFNTAIGKGTNPLLPTTPLLSPTDLIIDQYSGGPGSKYGVGLTTIRRFDVTSNGSNKPIPSKGKIDYAGTIGVSNKYYEGQLILEPIYSQNPTNKPSQVDQTAVKYKQNTPAGSNGTSTSPTTRKYADLITAVDKLKVKVIKDGKVVKGSVNIELDRTSPTYQYYGGKLTKQLATFERTEADQDKNLKVTFATIDPFTQEPSLLAFSAYIQNFRDNFDGAWNEFNYAGRAESFYTFGKFKRSIGFNLDIPCFNKEQLIANHVKLGQLASSTAGAYNSDGLLGGVLIQLNVGNYIKDEYGILTNISYEIPTESSWDIDNQLAMYLKATLSFNIIHKDLPKYRGTGFLNYA
jgi:hypothetical protein